MQIDAHRRSIGHVWMQGSARLVPGTIVDRRDHDVMRRALGLGQRCDEARARAIAAAPVDTRLVEVRATSRHKESNDVMRRALGR